jgi:hypothetical protein
MSGDGGRPDDWLGDYRPFDVFDQFAEAQRLGLDAATSLMGRFTELFARAVDDGEPMDPSSWFGARDDDGGRVRGRNAGTSAADEMRTMRAEATRSMDTVLEMARRLFESSLDMADTAMRRPNVSAWISDAPTAEALTVRVVVGGTRTARLWLHQRERDAVPKVRCSVTPLRSAGGDVPELTATFEPSVLTDLEPGESRSIHLHLDALPDCAPGSYWGLVLADGMGDLALTLRVDVMAPDLDEDDHA